MPEPSPRAVRLIACIGLLALVIGAAAWLQGSSAGWQLIDTRTRQSAMGTMLECTYRKGRETSIRQFLQLPREAGNNREQQTLACPATLPPDKAPARVEGGSSRP